MTAPAGKKPEGIYQFIVEDQPPRKIALVATSTALGLKTRLPDILYTLKGVAPEDIRLFVDKREIQDDEVITQTVPDGTTIRVEVRKR